MVEALIILVATLIWTLYGLLYFLKKSRYYKKEMEFYKDIAVETDKLNEDLVNVLKELVPEVSMTLRQKKIDKMYN